MAQIPLGWLRFPLSDLPRQFLLPSLPWFVSSPSSLYGLIFFKGKSFHAIFREGFKGNRWALELAPFNWSPGPCPSVSLLMLYFSS